MASSIRVGALLIAASLLITGCWWDEEAAPPSPSPFSGIVSTMDASEFHAIGVAVGAEPLVPGSSIADALNAEESELQQYVDDLCHGEPLVLWPLAAFPAQVPAYEELLAIPAQQCGVSTVALDRERGRLATKMIAGQDFLNTLSDGAAVVEFCDVLDHSSDITTAVIVAAAEKLHVGETGSELVELGVKLMIGGCPALLTRVS